MDANGESVRSATAYLSRERMPAKTAKVTEGAALFTGVSVGEWKLVIQSIGWKVHREDITVTGDVSPIELRIVLEPDPQSVLVKLETLDGRRLCDCLSESDRSRWSAAIAVIPSLEAMPVGGIADDFAGQDVAIDGRTWLLGAMQNSNGVALDSRFDGYISATKDRPWYVSLLVNRTVECTELVKPEMNIVTLRVDPNALSKRSAEVKVRVVDFATGAPIQGAAVTIGKITVLGSGGYSVGVTSISGEAIVEGVSPGQDFLQVRARGYAITSRCLETIVGHRLDLGEIPLKRGVVVAGSIRTPDGKSVTTNLTLLTQLNSSVGDATNRFHPVTRSGDGDFRFTDIAPGTYTLRLTPSKGYAATAIDLAVPDGGIDNLQIELKQGALVSIRRDDNNSEPAYVVIKNKSGCRIKESLLGQRQIGTGAYLEPGRYILEVHTRGGQSRETVIDVGRDPITVTVP